MPVTSADKNGMFLTEFLRNSIRGQCLIQRKQIMRERDVLKYSCLFCADKGLNVECKIVKFLR